MMKVATASKRSRFYKKMAGTSAVFIDASHEAASPVERDGMIWSEAELGIGQEQGQELCWRAAVDNTLALEGLEDYNPPQNGDARFVSSQCAAFIYIQPKKAWVQITRSC